jgi:hypothetical protein
MVVCDTPEQIRGMIEGELIALYPSNLRRAREILAELPGVIEMQTFGNQLRIFVRDASAAIEQVNAALSQQDIKVLDARRTQPRMEEAYISMVRRQDARPRNGASQQGGETT